MKKRMRVNYFVPGRETSNDPPSYKYEIVAEPHSEGRWQVTIVDLNPPETPRAISDKSVFRDESAELAVLSGLARLNSFHDGLKPIPGDITEGDKPQP